MFITAYGSSLYRDNYTFYKSWFVPIICSWSRVAMETLAKFRADLVMTKSASAKVGGLSIFVWWMQQLRLGVV